MQNIYFSSLIRTSLARFSPLFKWTLFKKSYVFAWYHRHLVEIRFYWFRNAYLDSLKMFNAVKHASLPRLNLKLVPKMFYGIVSWRNRFCLRSIFQHYLLQTKFKKIGNPYSAKRTDPINYGSGFNFWSRCFKYFRRTEAEKNLNKNLLE